MGVLPDLKFTEVKKGLEHCLTEFLKRENFRSIPAPCHARLANSYVPLQNIRGIKNRVKQLLVRYMPKPLFNRIIFGYRKINLWKLNIIALNAMCKSLFLF